MTCQNPLYKQYPQLREKNTNSKQRFKKKTLKHHAQQLKRLFSIILFPVPQEFRSQTKKQYLALVYLSFAGWSRWGKNFEERIQSSLCGSLACFHELLRSWSYSVFAEDDKNQKLCLRTSLLKVFRYSFSETIPIFLYHLKRDFIRVRSL